MDEAAQAEAGLALAILRPETERLFLVGDPKQLPATIFSEVRKDAGYDRSLMERCAICDGSSPDSILLNIQHCLAMVKSEVLLWQTRRRAVCPWSFFRRAPFSVCERHSGQQVPRFLYRTEAAVVVEFLNDLKFPKGASTGVVTPYRSQREQIETALEHLRLPVDVNTAGGRRLSRAGMGRGHLPDRS